MHQVCSTLNRFHPAVPLVLRVVLGGLFVWHGIDKFDVGIDMIKDMFTVVGRPGTRSDGTVDCDHRDRRGDAARVRRR